MLNKRRVVNLCVLDVCFVNHDDPVLSSANQLLELRRVVQRPSGCVRFSQIQHARAALQLSQQRGQWQTEIWL